MTHCHGQNRNVHAKYIVILNATKAATKAKIYGWTNSRERVQHIQKKPHTRCTLNLYIKWGCFSGCRVRMSWMFGTGGYKFFETGVGGCVYFLHVWMWSRYSVKRMKNGQEYCSVLRVQFSMNQKQLSWLLFHTLPSARKWDFFFFQIFFAGKVFAEWNQMRYFFPYRMLKCWRFGADSLETRKLSFGDSRGGLPYICPSPKALLDPLLYWIITACKILSPLLSNLPRLVCSLAWSDSTNHHCSLK